MESRERLGAQFYHRIRGEQIPGFRFNESCRPATTHEIDIPSTYSRLVTKDWGVFFTETFRILDVANKGRLSGFDNLVIGTQYQLYTDPEHQFVFTVGGTAAIGGTGAPGIASSFSTLTPTIYIGKGFGDLPDSVAWLRPLTISATAAVAVPTESSTLTSLGTVNLPRAETGAFTSLSTVPSGATTLSETINPKILQLGFRRITGIGGWQYPSKAVSVYRRPPN